MSSLLKELLDRLISHSYSSHSIWVNSLSFLVIARAPCFPISFPDKSIDFTLSFENNISCKKGIPNSSMKSSLIPLFFKVTVERQRISSMPSKNSRSPALEKFLPRKLLSSIFSTMWLGFFSSKFVVVSFFFRDRALLPFEALRRADPPSGIDLTKLLADGPRAPAFGFMSIFFLGSFRS